MTSAPAHGPFEHSALVHDSLEDLVTRLAPFIHDGIDRDEPVLVVLEGSPLEAVRDAMGPESGAVRWAETTEWHPHPAARLRAVHEHIRRSLEEGAPALRVVGEPVWPSDTHDDELTREWHRFESVSNAILAPFRVSAVCTYDASRLPPAIVSTASRTHPAIIDPVQRPSEDYEQPARFLRVSNLELGATPASAARMSPTEDLHGVRAFVVDHATGNGLARERALDLCVAVNEAVENALTHGGDDVALAIWSDGSTLRCQVEDSGAGIGDPLAGYRPPPEELPGGRGLWLARQLVDLLQLGSGDGRTRVRLSVDLPRPV